MLQNTKRIVITGPESTGKSTLTRALARNFGAPAVAEYARTYLEQLQRPYTEEDLLTIAALQIRAEDEAALHTRNNLLFCDTDLYVLKVWSEHKYGRCHRQILETIATRRYDLYLLTGIDMAWEDDPLREHPQPVMRQYFYNIYLDIVQQSGIPFVLINGGKQERLRQAIHAVQDLLSSNGCSIKT